MSSCLNLARTYAQKIGRDISKEVAKIEALVKKK